MNTDSKLKRFIVILDKAPFILFLESPDYVTISVNPLLRSLGFLDGDAIVVIAPIEIYEQTSLRRVFAVIDNNLPDTHAYNIIEALANAMSTTYFKLDHFTSAVWQNYIEWQNVDNKPAPLESFTITVDKFTHKLSIKDDVNTVIKEDDYEGVIHLDRADPTAPLPLRLLKECVIDIHDIMTKGAIGRTFTSITASQYMSAVQAGYDTFYYTNMKKLEKGLRTALTEAGITIEE